MANKGFLHLLQHSEKKLLASQKFLKGRDKVCSIR